MLKELKHTIRYIKLFFKIKYHNFKNKNYWTKYYRLHREESNPSPFATYCLEKYCSSKSNAKLLELGCGNGRDSFFFAKNKLQVLGLDLVQEEISYLNKKNSHSNLSFKCADFTSYNNNSIYDFIYSRFTMHTISKEQEDITLKNSFKNLKEGGLFFIEARSIKDDMFNKSKKISETEGETDHYRRFLIYENFLQNVKDAGFKIIESTEAQGLAKYKDQDPFIIRIVAKK